MSQQTKHLYEFGSFRLDAVERLLLRDGEIVSLAPKAFDLLLVLVEHHGHLIEKEELLNLVWPDTFVEEANLSWNVSHVRKALEENGVGQRFIETVPRRGYRFVANVKRVEADNPAERPVKSPAEEGARASQGFTEGAGHSGPSPILTDDIIANPSSTRIVMGEIKRHKLGVSIFLVALLIAAVGAYFYFNPKPVLTDKDTILLADFVNTTGDPAFDGGTLKQGLAIQLQQSPFLNLFPDAGVRHVLRLMNKSPDERVTREVGREIALRQGLKAVIAGSIAKFERNYSLTLEAINSQTGESIALSQVETEDQVLKALSRAATQLREELGEPLSVIKRFNKPLEDATTANLEAFKAWYAGTELRYSGRMREAIPFLKRAVEIDADFATAYGDLSVTYILNRQPRLAAEYAGKAYALRDRVGEFEQLRITASYHGFVTGDYAKRTEVSMFQKRMYPRDWMALAQLCASYNGIGQFEEALVEAREAIRLNPSAAPAYRNMAWALVGLNRFAEAKDVLTQAHQLKLDMPDFHSFLYRIAFVSNDTAGMQQQIDWARGKPNEYVAIDWLTDAAAYAGQWRRAQELARRAIDLTARDDNKEVAAQYESEQAWRAAVFGQFKPARTAAANSLALERDQLWLHAPPALALALCGESSQTHTLVDELVKRYPNATRVNGLWVPVIRAALELQRGNAAQAIELLKAALRYEAAAAFWPQYLRGQAFLKLNKGSEAAAEFQKILDHRGEAPLSTLYPLAHLGLARALALAGDTAKSRKAYQDFFALWKDADTDLPILIEAKKEYGRLK